ncbi:hypothetical protein FF38_10001 [Lucilia cuprina]|uniref:Uncharacterized protein n=1 Tax=Lucilia cuprina TaxID=7375 RepID=A0A0L0C2V9_LUCCU|nr:hypothetical protein CVS40_1601 [Lucilia cuprina]KNC26572.1 hypothetical protein FF38_10001 [Lucilia cuprina]
MDLKNIEHDPSKTVDLRVMSKALSSLDPNSAKDNSPTDEENVLLASASNTQTSTSDDLTVTIQENSKDSKPKHCGAACKRFKFYIENCISIDKARKLCLKPMREVRTELQGIHIPSKRSRSNGRTPEKPNPSRRHTGPTAIDSSADTSNIVTFTGTTVVTSTVATATKITAALLQRCDIIPKNHNVFFTLQMPFITLDLYSLKLPHN